jgi:hypothetical protein
LTRLAQHIAGKKHRKFAANNEHFEQLDSVLDRIRRPVRPDYAARRRATILCIDPNPDHESSSPPLSALPARDLRSSSEVSDYLPQPQVDYTLADIGAAIEPEYDDTDVAMRRA